MKRPILIIGSGGHAKVLVATLRLVQREILGITEADLCKFGGMVSGIPIIGNDEAIFQYKPNEIELVNGIGSVGQLKKRMEVFQSFKRQNYFFTSVIHPSAIVVDDVRLGEGVQIMAGTILQAGCSICDNVILNTGAIIDHDCEIGAHTHIAPGAVLSGAVKIGETVHIGTGAVIIQGIKIGSESIVGAGAVVISDIPAQKKAIGVPARILQQDAQQHY